ncbi:hypothetical protein KY320_03445 [Candidatus Woesearchaeota archaeon]|nr:hypothetical protein [Candidatus Woesearchaeota archaeon]
MTEKEEPNPIEMLKERQKHAKKIIDTIGFVHSDAYNTAVEKHLRPDLGDGKKGDVDYSLLEDPNVQEKFISEMVGVYVDEANQYLNSTVPKDDPFRVNMLLQAYSGASRTQLEMLVRKNGKNYTIDAHNGKMDELKKSVGANVSAAASSHIRKEHIPKFVKHMKLDDIVNQELMDEGDIVLLHELFEQYGVLTPEIIKDAYKATKQAEPVYLKKKKTEKNN